jgi:hypothetical protein
MEEVDKIVWEKFISNLSSRISRLDFEMICTLHAKYYNHKYKEPCTCNPQTIKNWIAQLNDIYESDTEN